MFGKTLSSGDVSGRAEIASVRLLISYCWNGSKAVDIWMLLLWEFSFKMDYGTSCLNSCNDGLLSLI